MTRTDEQQQEVWRTLCDNNSDFVARVSAVLAAEIAATAAARLAPADFVATFAPVLAAKVAADPAWAAAIAADPEIDVDAAAIRLLAGIPGERAKDTAVELAASIAGAAAVGTAAGDVLEAPYFARIAETAISEVAERDSLKQTERAEWQREFVGMLIGSDRFAGVSPASVAASFAYWNAVSPAIAAAAPAIAAKIAGIAEAEWDAVISRAGITRP